MRILPIAAILLAALPAAAQEAETLRLACSANDTTRELRFAFSIDTAARDAVETLSGKTYAAAVGRDHIVLSDAGGPVFRIDRITGSFARVDKQLPLEGRCDKAERKF